MGETPFERLPAPILDTNGNLAPGAKAYFTVAVDTPLTVYQDAGLTTPHTNPVVADASARLPFIFLPYGDYNVRVTTASGAAIFSAMGCANPAPPADGGGGGIVVTQAQIFQTGWPIPLLQTATPTGFVPMTGLTIGNAASGATARANPDTEDLFAHLWDNLADAVAAVSGGRGASAAADYAANKTIVVPTMSSYVAGGRGSSLTTTLGGTTGAATYSLASGNLPSFTTSVESQGHVHAYAYPNTVHSFAYSPGPTSTPNLLLPGAGTFQNTNGNSVNHTHSFTGSATAISLNQLTRVFNWFMKL